MTKRKPNKEVRSDTNDNYLNYRLRNARLKADYTQSQLGGLVGVKHNGIARYETLVRFPKNNIAKKIAEVLGEEVEELFPKTLIDITTEINQYRRNGKKDVLDHEDTIPINRDLRRKIENSSFYNDDPSKSLIEEDRKKLLGELMGTLHGRDKQVIELRYGLVDGHYYNLEQIGQIMSISRERVRQLESGAIRILKAELREIDYRDS